MTNRGAPPHRQARTGTLCSSDDTGMEDLIARWRTLVSDEATGSDLLARWSEPHRRYHDVPHLRAVLDAVDELADFADDPDAVRLAAWFHDAVYAGRPGADEEASAQLAASTLPGVGVSDERVAEVVRLVELTATHDPEPDDTNGAVLCDADLAILGGDAETYAGYAAAVREEYAHVAEEQFRRGRAELLERLLASKPLYRTAVARDRWEEAARRNLRTELALLRGGASAS
jgi:predicted metal-dependent HD superfamily phosphohydrolase